MRCSSARPCRCACTRVHTVDERAFVFVCEPRVYFYASFHKRNGRNDVSNRCCDYRRNRDRGGGNERMNARGRRTASFVVSPFAVERC